MSDQTPAEDDIDRQLRELTEGRADSGQGVSHPPPSARRLPSNPASRRRSGRARPRRPIRRTARRSRGRRRGAQALSWTIVIVVLAVAGLLSWHRFAPGTGSTAAGGTVGNPKPATAGPPADPFAGTPADQSTARRGGDRHPRRQGSRPLQRLTGGGGVRGHEAVAHRGNSRQADPGGRGADGVRRPAHALGADAVPLRPQRARGVPDRAVAQFSLLCGGPFASGTAELIGSVIKVKASMSAQTFGQSGMVVLDIKVSDLATYPIERPGDPGTWMRVVADVYGSFSFAHWDNQSRAPAALGPDDRREQWRPVPDDRRVGPSRIPQPAGRSRTGAGTGGNPYTPISTAPSALPTAVATSGSACTVDSGST